MFKCSTCKEMLPREAFGNEKTSRGFSYRCTQCERARSSKRREDPDIRERHRLATIAWREANPDKVMNLRLSRKDVDRDAHLKRTYNISSEDYDAMLLDQEGACAFCGKTPEENGQRLAVDHDHTCCPGRISCGKCVRGLLCSDCNLSIGRMDDDVDRLQRAIDYIRSHRGQ